ncbi:MAG: hypothetical protein SWK76_06130 [Actinomycetota bacterium]|nr:hypothetical protein [Actinomycetota bacterium]
MSRSHDCSLCGFPRALNRKLVWTTDGGIYFQTRNSDRLIFLDEGDISSIMGVAERECGENIMERLRECRRSFSREEVSSQLSGLRRFLFRRWPLAKRVVTSTFREAAFFGCGNITISDISPRKQLIIKARHPYHPHLLAGDIWGFWEGLYGVEAELSISPESELEWNITVRTTSKSKRKTAPVEHPKRPDRDYNLEVCEKCKLPRFYWDLRWDSELGTIYEAGSHRHLTITSVEGWRRVIGVIRNSLGDGFHSSIGAALPERAASDFALLKGDNYKTAYRNFFLGLSFLGWGRPQSVSRKPFLIDVDIIGVPFPQLLAWKMAGVFEALESEPAEIQHEKNGESQWSYLVSPHLNGVFLEIERMKPERGDPIYPRPILPY